MRDVTAGVSSPHRRQGGPAEVGLAARLPRQEDGEGSIELGMPRRSYGPGAEGRQDERRVPWLSRA